FYTRVAEAAAAHPDTSAFFVRCRIIDENGTMETVAQRLRSLALPSRCVSEIYYSNALFTPGVVIRRAFYEEHGGFLPELVHCADWEMWVRAVGTGGGLWLNELLSSYRSFSGNDTGRLARTAENLRDRLRAGWVFAERFPEFDMGFYLKVLARVARHQSRRFAALGDVGAEVANREIYHALTLPAQRRLHDAWDRELGVPPIEDTPGARQQRLFARTMAARLRNRDVMIWGAGQAGLGVLRKLREQGVEVTAFLDSDERKQGGVVEGLPVRSPGWILAEPRPFVVVASMYSLEICGRLKEQNFKRERDFLVS
ncbi:MAG: hypothetical protein WAO20_03465, partial [Acidobacteriota bacterium]